MKKKFCIVMPSLGCRPFVRASALSFQQYSSTHGVDFIVEQSLPHSQEFNLPALPDTPGRPNKLAYALKAYYVYKYLFTKNYERVLVVDDSCVISPRSPNVFKFLDTPGYDYAYTKTAKSHARDSFSFIKNIFPQENIIFDEEYYMNSGVMLYNQSCKEAFHPDRIIMACYLLFSKMPNQTLTYYLLQSNNLKGIKMPKSYNTIPGIDKLPKAERIKTNKAKDLISNDIFIYHYTTSFQFRSSLIQQTSEILLQK